MQSKELNYLQILDESLDKKIEILRSIEDINKRQSDLLSAAGIDYDAFDATVEEKAVCIENINNLDNGFQSVFDRVKDMLQAHKEQYIDRIRTMQEKIKQIMALSMDIQAQESRNKAAFQEKVRTSKKEIKTAKTANKVAANYYHSMNGLNMVSSQFLDTKK